MILQPKQLTSKNNLNVAGCQDTIDAFTIDVGSFGTAEMQNFRVRDIGAGYNIPFIIKGNGYIGMALKTLAH